MATLAANFKNIARAVSAYADEEYTDAVRIAGTALIGTDARINANAEDYYGTIRWDDTLGALNYSTTQTSTDTHINNATETSDEGLVTDMSTSIAEYIKTYRTHGANQFNVTSVITQRSGAIEKVAKDFGITRARDADASVVSVIKGVIQAELAFALNTDGSRTATAGQGDADTLDSGKGFFYDTNNPTAIATPPTVSEANKVPLVNTAATGGKAAVQIFTASAVGYADLEPEFMYLVIQPSVYLDMKIGNLLDADSITDGNIKFESIMNGKYRLLVSRTNLGNYASNGAVGARSVKTSLLILPGSISMTPVAVTNPVAFDNDESVGRGAGQRELWYRWGNVYHPRGYTWAGSKTAFALNAAFEVNTAWTRVETVGNLGILPIFHA